MMAFTLIEVRIAFAIAALSLSVLFRGSAESMRGVQIAGLYDVALSLAQSRLAAATVGQSFMPGVQDGEDGKGLRWRVTVIRRASAPPMALFSIAVVVYWNTDGQAREVRLESARTGVAAQRAP